MAYHCSVKSFKQGYQLPLPRKFSTGPENWIAYRLRRNGDTKICLLCNNSISLGDLYYMRPGNSKLNIPVFYSCETCFNIRFQEIIMTMDGYMNELPLDLKNLHI